jgi:hypothetical protein
MERDLILGYMLIKLGGLLAMYLQQREAVLSYSLAALSVAGITAGAVFLWRSMRKARALRSGG